MVFCNQQNHRIQVCNSLQQQQCFMSPASVWLSDCWMVQMTATCGFLGTHECQHAFDACVCELVCLYKTVWLHARMCAWILCQNGFILTINVMSVLSVTEVSRLLSSCYLKKVLTRTIKMQWFSEASSFHSVPSHVQMYQQRRQLRCQRWGASRHYTSAHQIHFWPWNNTGHAQLWQKDRISGLCSKLLLPDCQSFTPLSNGYVIKCSFVSMKLYLLTTTKLKITNFQAFKHAINKKT